MLTNNILSCYNHLLATTLIYFTFVDPMQDISNSLKSSNSPDTPEHNSFPFITLVSAEDTRDYYQILGVAKDATKHDIHKAFRQLAKKYHPDKNKEKGAQDEFIKIFKAYETLSDEKKRKEYDERDQMPNYGSFNSGGNSNGWQAHQMNDFDMNEFFKQYTEQLHRHANYYQQGQDHGHEHDHHHHQHHKASHFHGINLDDLFHDIDQDELGRLFDFGSHHQNLQADFDGHFGDGASFFGSHFPSQIHDTIHQYQHLRSGGAGVGGSHGGSAYSCHTVTQKVNGVVMTQTSCG